VDKDDAAQGTNPEAVHDSSSTIVSRKRNQAQVRLGPSDVAALVEGYQAGSTLEEVASEFGVHVQTAAAHLKRQGVPQRRQRLTDEQVAEAVQLYEGGWSTIRIGEYLGVYPQSIQYRLKRIGVKLRTRPGWGPTT
jgi:hypothetical protein